MSRSQDLSSDELLALVVGRRWFGAKEREPEGAHVAAVAFADGDLELALVEVRFLEGTHDTYALALCFADGAPEDALDRPSCVRRLAALCGVDTPCATVRPIGVEQSNSSVVLDEAHVALDAAHRKRRSDHALEQERRGRGADLDRQPGRPRADLPQDLGRPRRVPVSVPRDVDR